jgi:nucleotide-binding universal stress UspA family protein
MKPSTILFATDFGEAARRALAEVELLAKIHAAAVHLVHVHHVHWKTWPATELVESQARGRLADWARELERRGARVAGFELLHGSAAEAILHNAERRGVAELIVIGAGDKALGHRQRTGATAETVARFATQPVWISRPTAAGSIVRVLCALDCSEGSGQALFDAVELCSRLGAELTLVNALGDPSELGLPEADVAAQGSAWKERHVRELEAFVRRFDLRGLEPTRRWLWGAPSEVIRELVREEAFDLAVLGRKGFSGLRRVLLGATAERVLRELPCSLLLTGPA